MNDEERYADYLEGGTLDGTLDEGARGRARRAAPPVRQPEHVERTSTGPRRRHRRRDPRRRCRDAGAGTRASGAPASGADPHDPRRGRRRAGARHRPRSRARDARRNRRGSLLAGGHRGDPRGQRPGERRIDRLRAVDLAHRRRPAAGPAGHVLPGVDAGGRRVGPDRDVPRPRGRRTDRAVVGCRRRRLPDDDGDDPAGGRRTRVVRGRRAAGRATKNSGRLALEAGGKRRSHARRVRRNRSIWSPTFSISRTWGQYLETQSDQMAAATADPYEGQATRAPCVRASRRNSSRNREPIRPSRAK